MNSDQPPVLFLMGPTAAGKTGVAMDLVQRLDADIISVDSAMIYIGMDIGTAKPSAEELAAAPHALIDLIDPTESWSVGEFCVAAKQAIATSHANNRLPILAGGTMMYFRALEHGLAELPEADEATRNVLNERALKDGWPALHAQLAEVDQETASRIHPNDSQRVQRALEVFHLTGQPLSKLQENPGNCLESPIIKCALSGHPREQLHARIEQRFDQMMDQGFLQEVSNLYARGDLHADMPSMRSVGYRQMWQHLAGLCDVNEAVALAKTATRQLAKRQLTWLRSDCNLHNLSTSKAENIKTIMKILAQ